MKMYFLITSLCALTIASAHAGWQVATPRTAAPREPFFQAASQPHHPSQMLTPARPKCIVPAPTVPIAAMHFQGGIKPAVNQFAFPRQQARLGQPVPVYVVTISGSVKDNLERILQRYRWRVIWKAPFDYNFDGRVTGGSVTQVVEKILAPFPLQAVMYVSNRTVTIVPRTRL